MSTRSNTLKRLTNSLRRRPSFLLGSAFVAAVLAPGGAAAKDTAFIRSLLLPGSGQAHQGHYAKASLFVGAAIISATGAFASQIQYDQAVEQFNASKSTYDALAADLAGGGIVSATDIDDTYAAMTSAQDSADARLKWRNFFLTALAATYTLNLIDVLMSGPHDPETALRIEMHPERVLLSKSFRF